QTCFACSLIWHRRRYPCIRYRSPRLTLSAAIGICAMIALMVARANNQAKIPCAVVLWMSGIVYPVIYISIIGRCVKLYFFYQISEAKLEDALTKMGGEPSLVSKKPAKFPFSKRKSHESVELRSLTQTNSVEASQLSSIKHDTILENNWFYQRRYVATPNYMTTWLIIFVLIHSGINALVHLFSIRLNQSPAPTTDCYAGMEYVPRRVLCYVYGLVIIPILILLMRNAHDAYGIRRELASATAVNVIGDTLQLIFVSTDKIRDEIDPDVSGLIWTLIPLVLVYILLIVVPLFESYLIDLRKGKPLSHPIVKGKSLVLDRTRESFEAMLQKPNIFYQFKMFAVADFTVECVLFYEAFARIATLSNSTSPEVVQEHLKDIYETFIAPHARFQVNLTDDTFRQIRIQAKNGHWEVEMYSLVQAEVKELMFRNTYPRFLVRYRRGDYHWDDLIEGA
ncbi:hypothetical protein K493DRAFT_382241, partial [Basidiobolus meristosporus CBS 931.73]